MTVTLAEALVPFQTLEMPQSEGETEKKVDGVPKCQHTP